MGKAYTNAGVAMVSIIKILVLFQLFFQAKVTVRFRSPNFGVLRVLRKLKIELLTYFIVINYLTLKVSRSPFIVRIAIRSVP